ncbi:MAG: hypothetical protein AAF824_17365 [Bacteroidota bacterium]
MESQVKPLIAKLSSQQLLSICNEKMISAARDLAEFTKHGIHADFIVALAYKCENLEKILGESFSNQDPKKIRDLEQEIIHGLTKICETAKKIWKHVPHKYKPYSLSAQSLYPRNNNAANVA